MRLAAGLLLLKLLVITLAGLALYHSRHQYEYRAKTATQNLAELVAHDVAGSFDRIDLALLAARDEAQRQLAAGGIDRVMLDAYLARQRDRVEGVSALQVSDTEGNISGDIGIGAGKRRDIAGHDYFLRLRADPHAGLVISKPLSGRDQGKRLIVLARRIEQPHGNFAGIVLATVGLDYFTRLFATLDTGAHGAVGLLYGDLDLLARYPPLQDGAMPGGPPALREKIKAEPVSGTGYAAGLDQRRRILSYRRLNTYPMYVIVGLYPDDFLMEWRREAARTITLTAIFLVVTTAFLLLIRRTWKRREADARRLAELSRRLVSVQESERRQLALELHDVVSPNLAALHLNLDGMLAELPRSVFERCGARLSDIRAILDDTNAGLREICSNLRPAMLDYSGLLPALKDYAAQFSRSASAVVQVQAAEPLRRLAPDIESLLFRIAQEAVTNCVRHARAKNVIIKLAQEDGRTRLSIADDGIGFDPRQVGRNGHRPGLGLITMRERAEFAGGRFSMESQPGRGTRISVEI